jgi:hypothetical protein
VFKLNIQLYHKISTIKNIAKFFQLSLLFLHKSLQSFVLALKSSLVLLALRSAKRKWNFYNWLNWVVDIFCKLSLQYLNFFEKLFFFAWRKTFESLNLWENQSGFVLFDVILFFFILFNFCCLFINFDLNFFVTSRNNLRILNCSSTQLIFVCDVIV